MFEVGNLNHLTVKGSRNQIPICTKSDQLENLNGRTVTIEAVIKHPDSKRFPPILYMSDGAKVAFILSEKLDRGPENISKYYDKKVQMTGVLYLRGLPDEFESHLDLPYVVDVETIEVIQ